MRKTLPLFGLLVLSAVLAGGCANPERKLGRGLSNTFEIIRMGEMRRTVEQTALFESPSEGYTTGFIRGFERTFARTGIGLYEVVTFPFPNPGRGYDPVGEPYLAPGPVFPDNYKPSLIEDSMFATDTTIGFSGGDSAPFIPGSRFRIFETH